MTRMNRPEQPPERRPNRLPRPKGELDELRRVWATPTGFRKLTAVNNTVIGVFFAGAIGLYAVFSRLAPSQFSIESFIFGQPTAAKARDLIYLFVLLLALGIFLMRKLMDEVHYESRPDHSNILTMTKRKR